MKATETWSCIFTLSLNMWHDAIFILGTTKTFIFARTLQAIGYMHTSKPKLHCFYIIFTGNYRLGCFWKSWSCRKLPQKSGFHIAQAYVHTLMLMTVNIKVKTKEQIRISDMFRGLRIMKLQWFLWKLNISAIFASRKVTQTLYDTDVLLAVVIVHEEAHILTWKWSKSPNVSSFSLTYYSRGKGLSGAYVTSWIPRSVGWLSAVLSSRLIHCVFPNGSAMIEIQRKAYNFNL